MIVERVSVGDAVLPFNASAYAGDPKFGAPAGGALVDSGFTFPAFPAPVLAALVGELRAQYAGTMDGATLARLLNTSAPNGAWAPPYCVPATMAELDGFPTVTYTLRASGSPAATATLAFPPEHYLFAPNASLPLCFALGLQSTGPGADTVIGQMAMQGHTVFYDQDEKVMAFVPNAGSSKL